MPGRDKNAQISTLSPRLTDYIPQPSHPHTRYGGRLPDTPLGGEPTCQVHCSLATDLEPIPDKFPVAVLHLMNLIIMVARWEPQSTAVNCSQLTAHEVHEVGPNLPL